jgi:hypothetical protein
VTLLQLQPQLGGVQRQAVHHLGGGGEGEGERGLFTNPTAIQPAVAGTDPSAIEIGRHIAKSYYTMYTLWLHAQAQIINLSAGQGRSLQCKVCSAAP